MLTVPRSDTARRSELVRFRRALTLLAMTLVLPGSAQLTCGNKAVGRAALRIVGILAVGALIAFLAFGRNGLVRLGFESWVLVCAEVAVVVLALAWVALFVDAWRLGRPPTLLRPHRLAAAGLSLTLMAGVATPMAYGAHLMQVQRDFITSNFVEGGIKELYNGRLNILLLGGDGGKNREGIRADSINLASIDVATGRTVMFGLPRNMQYVQFPPGTPAAEKYPNGFPQFLFSVYTEGEQNPDLFPGTDEPGALAMQQAVAQTLGVPVHYYALVNLSGFRKVIDALGGITIRVQNRLPIGGGTSLSGVAQPITGYIEPGLQKLDGYHALWYARSRATSTDYARMERQRCVLGAILREANPATILTNYSKLTKAVGGTISTDLSIDAVQRLVDVSSLTKNTKVISIEFNPPLIDPAEPDLAFIRERVQAALDKSAAQAAQAAAEAPPPPTGAPAEPLTEQEQKKAAKKAKKAAKKAAEAEAEAASSAEEGGEAVALESTCQYE